MPVPTPNPLPVPVPVPVQLNDVDVVPTLLDTCEWAVEGRSGMRIEILGGAVSALTGAGEVAYAFVYAYAGVRIG